MIDNFEEKPNTELFMLVNMEDHLRSIRKNLAWIAFIIVFSFVISVGLVVLAYLEVYT